MLKKCVLIAVTLGLGSMGAAFAHHVSGHEDAPVVRAPQIQFEITPPPAPPPPPPAAPVTFQAPVLLPSTVLPTDVTGFRAGINAPQPKPQPLTKEELAALLAKDPRFEFSGQWVPFSAGVALPAEPEPKGTFEGRVEYLESASALGGEPAFMPTVDASFSRINSDHLKVADGAVLVRAGDRPVYISTKLCDEYVVTRVSGGSIALVSSFDQKPTILNLTDKCCGAVSVKLPAETASGSTNITLNAGQIAEAYKLDAKPTSYQVATRIEVNKRIGKHCGLLVSQCHYLRALKRYNIAASLPPNDFNRVLKTAAAMQYVKR